MTNFPSRARETAIRRTSERWDRQPSSSSPRAAAKALAASVGQIVRPARISAHKATMTASSSGGDSFPGGVMRFVSLGPSNTSRGSRAYALHRDAGGHVDRQTIVLDQHPRLVEDDKVVVHQNVRLVADLLVLVRQVLDETLEVELYRRQSRVVGDVLQSVPVVAFIWQADLDDCVARAVRGREYDHCQGQSAHVSLLAIGRESLAQGDRFGRAVSSLSVRRLALSIRRLARSTG